MGGTRDSKGELWEERGDKGPEKNTTGEAPRPERAQGEGRS